MNNKNNNVTLKRLLKNAIKTDLRYFSVKDVRNNRKNDTNF